MKTTTGVKINGTFFSREDFRELIQNLQETAKALREYKENVKNEEDGIF